MTPLKPILFLCALSMLNCSNDTSDNNDYPDSSISDYTPNAIGNYWIYDVESSSVDALELNFKATDSLYIATSTLNSYTLEANNGTEATGTMNTILINGVLSKTSTTLEYTGTLELPIDIPIDQIQEINALKILDLEAENDEILSEISGNFSENIDFLGTMAPIEVSYSLTTKKENHYPNLLVNNTMYENVYEGILNLNLSIVGTITILGFSQSIQVIKAQDILTIRYYYGENIGLLRAESTQGYELSAELISLIELSGDTFDMGTSTSVESAEALSTYVLN